MELTLSSWYRLSSSYTEHQYGLWKGLSWFEKIAIRVFLFPDWVVSELLITFGMLFLFASRYTIKFTFFLVKTGLQSMVKHPVPAVAGAGAVIIGLLLFSFASQTSSSPEPVVKSETYPTNKSSIRGKSLTQVLNEWNKLYKDEKDFRIIANKIEKNLGIDGRKFFAALDFHESGGNGLRIGDTGLDMKAYGRLQIRQMALDDLQESGLHHRIDDITGNTQRDLLNCATAFDTYVSRYLKSGEESDLNAYLNTWNGGPSGTKAETQYTRAVKSILMKIEG